MMMCDMETIIQFYRDEGGKATLYTSDPVMMRKFDKLCDSSPHYCPDPERLPTHSSDTGEVTGKWYILDDISLLTFRTDKVKRNMTDEQRAAASERMKALRMAKNTLVSC